MKKMKRNIIFLCLIICWFFLFLKGKNINNVDSIKFKNEQDSIELLKKDSLYRDFYLKERKKIFEIIKFDIKLFEVSDTNELELLINYYANMFYFKVDSFYEELYKK